MACFMIVLAVALASDAERTVVIPRDTTPFKVSEKDIVRLTGKGIAGAQIKAKVEGPAKIEAENFVQERVKGQRLIGLTVRFMGGEKAKAWWPYTAERQHGLIGRSS